MMDFSELTTLEIWEMASYVVTVVGLPYAVWLYFADARRERQNEDENVYLQLSDEYAKFSNVLLQNADLQLMGGRLPDASLTPEQRERKKIIYEMLVSLFERAFILVYEHDMDKEARRRWKSWEDYIRFWLQRDDFRALLPELLAGEDEDFVKYMKQIAG
ncbi:MAG: hypothetical protein AB7G06_05780 [Bdellovibrionales bacterium]